MKGFCSLRLPQHSLVDGLFGFECRHRTESRWTPRGGLKSRPAGVVVVVGVVGVVVVGVVVVGVVVVGVVGVVVVGVVVGVVVVGVVVGVVVVLLIVL